MRKSKLWKKLLGVEHLVFEDGDVEAAADGGEVLVFGVRPDHGHRHRCSRCGRRGVAATTAVRGAAGGGRWMRARCGCTWRLRHRGWRACGMASWWLRVPWARPGSRFTSAFEDQAAWLCANMTGTKAAQLLRTTWRSMQSIVERVVANLAGKMDRLAWPGEDRDR